MWTSAQSGDMIDLYHIFVTFDVFFCIHHCFYVCFIFNNLCFVWFLTFQSQRNQHICNYFSDIAKWICVGLFGKMPHRDGAFVKSGWGLGVEKKEVL